ncbi:hypothetical protein L2Y94_08905 [Luteibacter aegosomatis]|uniref:hypothetical protein n=1 Tax=Luteibacter aegosomatis TaxID=2911537 RepID=UPI001FF9051A|nr:hypothetical protein [Luteibacter aegosomatis]UPG87453.1 hypothetical protein L2Y94_08905 [Luteibacter aegosomatis]
MRKNLAVIYSDPKDPVALDLRNLGVDVFHVDELNPGLVLSTWPVPVRHAEASIFSRRLGGAVINRTFSLSGTLIGSRLEEAGIHRQWFFALIDDLLSGSECLMFDSGLQGISRSNLPLDLQWQRMRDLDAAIQTPKYATASGLSMPDLSGLADPMQKSVWSVFDWREERLISDDELIWDKFFVERPVGAAIQIYFVGDYPFTLAGKDVESDDALRRAADTLVTAAKKAFCAKAGELLAFWNGGRLSFHAYSPFLVNAWKLPSFRSQFLAHAGLAHERECLV